MLEKLCQRVDSLKDTFIGFRRHIYKYPDLSTQEYATTSFIIKKLNEAGIQAKQINTTSGPAVVADIISDENAETIAIRADIDALPIQDKIQTPYKSTKNGIKHACGHDFNAAVIFSTAYTLAPFIKDFGINLRCIFQPAEEVAQSGANALVKKGVLEGVSSILAVHACPDYDAGKIGMKAGALTAGVDVFTIVVHGSGGHSARPHESVDPILITNQIVSYLYSSVFRNFDPFETTVLSIGKVSSGTAPNIIPENCILEGTIRSFDIKIRKEMMELITEKVIGIARANDGDATVKWDQGPAPVLNDPHLTKVIEYSAAELLGIENTISIKKPSMGAEDFSFYLEKVPGALIRIGTAGENANYPLHNPNFDIDESAINIAVKLLCNVIYKLSADKLGSLTYLKKQKAKSLEPVSLN